MVIESISIPSYEGAQRAALKLILKFRIQQSTNKYDIEAAPNIFNKTVFSSDSEGARNARIIFWTTQELIDALSSEEVQYSSNLAIGLIMAFDRNKPIDLIMFFGHIELIQLITAFVNKELIKLNDFVSPSQLIVNLFLNQNRDGEHHPFKRTRRLIVKLSSERA